MSAGARLAAAILAVCLGGVAQAQDGLSQDGRDRFRGGGGFDRRQTGAPGVFDFYVLALSWSPAFCRLTGERRGSAQCEPGRRLGFVLHGLWPQYERGFPRACSAVERAPSRMAIEAAAGAYADEGLARHEWREHGTCSGLDPRRYFEAAGAAFRRVTLPERFRQGGTFQTSPDDVERAFVEANRGLRADMISVQCRAGLLEEVRLCLDKDLRGFRSCPDVDRGRCRAGVIEAPASE